MQWPNNKNVCLSRSLCLSFIVHTVRCQPIGGYNEIGSQHEMAPLLSFFSSLPPVLSLSGERNNEMGDEKGKREEVSDKRPTGVWNPFLGEQVRSEMIRRVWPLAAAVRCCCRRQRVPCLQINNGKGEQRKKNERRERERRS